MKTNERTLRYVDFLYRYRHIINIIAVIITALSLVFASKLRIRSSFSELLPRHLKSVQMLDEAARRVGGTGLLFVGIESPDYEANKNFIEALANEIRTMVGTQLSFFDYRYLESRNFLTKYGLHYLSDEELVHLRDHIRDEIEKEKDKAFGSFLGLEDDTESNESQTTFNIEESLDRVNPSFKKFLEYRDAYLSVDEGKTLVMTLRPMGSSLGVSEAREITSKVRTIIHQLDPRKYHPEMNVDLGGGVQSTVDEYLAIIADVKDTAVLLVFLILTILFIFLWSFKLIGLLTINLLFAVAWTFGATYLQIGYLNTQTAFMGSLVVGTGINYSIIFLSRYLEGKKISLPIREAVASAIDNTMTATILASTTTAVSFLSLQFAENKGFSQFGFIGGLGVLCCWIASYTLLPLWLCQLEGRSSLKEIHFRNPLGSWVGGLAKTLANLVTKHPRALAGILVVLSLAGYIGFNKLTHNLYEENFNNLRNKRSVESGTFAFERRIYRVFAESTTPAVVMLDNEEESKALCPSVHKRIKSLEGKETVFGSCVSLYELIPKYEMNSLRESTLLDIKNMLSKKMLRLKSVNLGQFDLKELGENLSLKPPTITDTPEELSRRFTELDGRKGLIAYINPRNDKPMREMQYISAFTKAFTDFPLQGTDKKISASNELWVFADLLNGIRIDGPMTSAISFLCVVVLAIFLSGGLKAGLFMAFTMSVATWWLLCTQGMAGIKYNFFNFIALPLTFGLGVDYPINVYLRCKQEKFQNFHKVLTSSGSAVFLCSLTTIIGYGTLLFASNQALVSFAWIAIIGEFATLTGAMILVPLMLRLSGKFKT